MESEVVADAIGERLHNLGCRATRGSRLEATGWSCCGRLDCGKLGSWSPVRQGRRSKGAPATLRSRRAQGSERGRYLRSNERRRSLLHDLQFQCLRVSGELGF